MEILSVNIGSLNKIMRNGKKVRSGIFKQSVEGPVEVHSLGLKGDYQANMKLHGGIDKAICVYPAEHYDWWSDELKKPDLPFGSFGENLTTFGLMEDTICIGDSFRIGSAEVTVTQPREPCVTLNARFGREDLAMRFKNSGKSGFYFSVTKEGTLNRGDEIEHIFKDENKVFISEFNRVLNGDRGLEGIMRRASKVIHLPKKLKDRLIKKLGSLGV